MRSIFVKQTKTLKQALHDTLHRHPTLSVEAIAEELDMSASYLYRAATPDPDTDGESASGVRYPLKQVVPLTRITGDYQVMDLLEYQLGRVAIPIPRNDTQPPELTQVNALKAVVKFGELMKEIQESLLDHKITEDEQARIDKGGMMAIQSIMLLLSDTQR